jgi:hypothetical protein
MTFTLLEKRPADAMDDLSSTQKNEESAAITESLV